MLPDLSGGGAEKVMVNLCNEFVRRGFDVTLALFRDTGPLVTSVSPVILKKVLASKANNKSPSSGESVPNLYSRIRSRIFQISGIVTLFRSIPNDAIIISSLNDPNFLAVFVNKILGEKLRVVCVQHNNLGASFQSRTLHARFWRHAVPWALREAFGVVAVSKGIAEDLARAHGISRKKISVIYNPVIATQFYPDSIFLSDPFFNADVGPRPFVVVGRLVKQKRIADVIIAISKNRLLGYDHRLAILGSGPEESKLYSLVLNLGLGDSVKFYGFVADPYPYIKNSEALILSSEYEGLPTVIIEALWLHTKVIASDCDFGPRELLGDGRFGKLYPVGEIDALSTCMIESLNPDDRRDVSPIIEQMFVHESTNSWEMFIRYLRD